MKTFFYKVFKRLYTATSGEFCQPQWTVFLPELLKLSFPYSDFYFAVYAASNFKFSSLMSDLIFKILLFYWIHLNNQNWGIWKIIKIRVNEQMCGYLFIWGYYNNSSKQIIHVHISLYAIYVFKNSLINLGHLGTNYHEPLYLSGCLEGYLPLL